MLAMLPFVQRLTTASEQTRTIVGPMSLERERALRSRGIKVSVLVDGRDVSNRCQFADDTPGHQVARLLKHNAEGKPYFDHQTREVARETVTKGIEIRLEKR